MKLDAGERVGDALHQGRGALRQGAAGDRRERAAAAGRAACELDGIHYLRAIGNSDAIREDAAPAERVVLIGGSYIGTEVAASLTAALRQAVRDRDAGGRDARALLRPRGRAASSSGVLEEHGVEVHGGEELERFEGADGRVQKVVTESGLELECDIGRDRRRRARRT